MRWEDERYVRFYTRDTPEWLALTWQARGLFGLLIRTVDRAGLLKVGKLGLKGAAVAVRAPWIEVETPLRELLEDGCVVLRGETLVIGNFLAAQEARQSDAARKRKEREMDLARANGTDVTARDSMGSQGVTPTGHAMGPNVTGGHATSHDVTPRHAVPSLAVPSLAEQSRITARATDATRNGQTEGQLAEPWPADLVEQLRAPLQRQLETNDDAWAEFLHTTAAKYPLQRRVNAGLVLLQRAETGEKFGLGYLLTLIRDGVEPRKQRQTAYANGNGVPIERMTVPASESKVLPPYVPPPESRDEMNKRLLDRAEAEIAKRKGRTP